ncbi:MAG TPA: hypothetical protein PKW17_10215 [Smithellaceae bacterium]|nr:hypothetical protein [Smithellaceae bacterium]
MDNIIAYRAKGFFLMDGTVLAGGNAPAGVTTLPVSAIGYSWFTCHGSHTANGLEGINRRGFCAKEGEEGAPTIDDHVVWEEGLFFDEAYSLQITGLKPDTPYRVAAVVEKFENYFYGEPLTISPRTTYMRATPVNICGACRAIFMADQGIQDADTCPNCGAAQTTRRKQKQ